MKSILSKFIQDKGMLFKEQVQIIKLTLEILAKELMPFEKKVDCIAKGKSLIVSAEEWNFV